MNEDIKNAISTEDPEVYDRIMRVFNAVSSIATICIMYEEGDISGKTGMEGVVERMVSMVDQEKEEMD